MSKARLALVVLLSGFFSATASASPPPPAATYQRVFIVVFENATYSDVIANPDFAAFAQKGVLLTHYQAITHPSEPNYLAMTGGSTFGITDDHIHTVNEQSMADLLEAKGLSWKQYAENYPGNCQRTNSGSYVDRHVPFLSYQNINGNLARCNAHVVDASQLQADIDHGQLPTLSFYSPNRDNDGHDTGVDYAGKWFSKTLRPLFNNPGFMNGTLVIVTFDEDDRFHSNQVYTVLYGSMVKPGTSSGNSYNHYSIPASIEQNFGLGNLGRSDATAPSFNELTRP